MPESCLEGGASDLSNLFFLETRNLREMAEERAFKGCVTEGDARGEGGGEGWEGTP